MGGGEPLEDGGAVVADVREAGGAGRVAREHGARVGAGVGGGGESSHALLLMSNGRGSELPGVRDRGTEVPGLAGAVCQSATAYHVGQVDGMRPLWGAERAGVRLRGG